MNREIEFRVWSHREKRWVTHYPLFNYCCETKNINTVFGNPDDDGYMAIRYDIQDCVFQQYTGLTDSKNQKIYEGDIIRITDPEGQLKKESHYFQGEYWMDDKSSPFEVTVRHAKIFWAEWGCWQMEYLDWKRTNAGEDTGKPVQGFVETKLSEVIGNIFENPELIK